MDPLWMERVSPSQPTGEIVENALKVTGAAACLLLVLRLVDEASGGGGGDGSHSHVVEESLRWMETSEQDGNPLIAFQHLNYASVLLSSARASSSDSKLEKQTGVDVRALSSTIHRRQKVLLSRLKRALSAKG